MTLSILYRGDLSSCNYDCPYCPFAKRKDSRETLASDAQQLQRFVQFVREQKAIQFKLFFTPWGEALIRNYYQQALVELSHLSNVQKVAIQTNLSCSLGFLKKANKQTLALWTTYHPGQVNRQAFIDKCAQLDKMGITYSVGIVGFKEVIEEIETMRRLLPKDRYVWVNALKKQSDYYNDEEKQRLIAVDPFVPYNMVHHESKGKACRTGETVISVDGNGNIYRCHFIKEKLGNLYTDDLPGLLFPRVCTNATCGCHIGYVHMNDLGLYDVFAGHELERIADAEVGGRKSEVRGLTSDLRLPTSDIRLHKKALPSSPKSRIMKSFLGMGLLGSNFVRAMLKRGETVQVWNRTAAKALELEKAGAKAFPEARDAVRGASVVHLALKDDAAVEAVLQAAAGGLTPGAVIIDHTTTSKEGAIKRTKEWKEKGFTYQHAPVFMGPANALDGTGFMLVSGDEGVISDLSASLNKMTGQVLNFGTEVGKAAAMKLAGNAFLVCLTAGLKDTLTLSKSLDVSVTDLLSLFNSWNPGVHVQARLQRMTGADHTQPSWELNMARKDTQLFIDATEQAGHHLVLLPAIAALMDDYIAKGFGGHDWTVIGGLK